MIARPSLPPPASPPAAVYVPGFRGWKLLACLCGVVLFCGGFVELLPGLRLVMTGSRAQAVATRIVKTKPGAPEMAVRIDSLSQTGPASLGDGSVFWNEFAFQTADGRTVAVRENVGSRMRPLYLLSDADGLPTTKLVVYDPRRPQDAIFPGEISTWLVPVGLMFAGLVCAVISAVLFHWANRPIELPEIAPPRAEPAP